MISRTSPDEAYVWIWLPGATEPVIAGRLFRDGNRLSFNYGRGYLRRADAIPLYAPELPLRSGAIPPRNGLHLASCLRDAAPDAWGRRVILNRLFGVKGRAAETGSIDELTYLLESGSDRIGALDFQPSPTEYTPRMAQSATLELLMTAADHVDAGISLTPDLDQALLHGTSLGGARPKAMLEENNQKWIAKFSLSSDTYNMVKAEFIAMRLASRLGLDVAPVRLERVLGRDILLVQRFDREKTGDGWRRRAMVSALTLFGLDEMMARYASYQDLAEIIRHRFTTPTATLRELFGRLVFNILCGNTDDHARNHAAFWDGAHLTLTPAYDVCPQLRVGHAASQAMLITGEKRMSTLANCLEAAPHFLLAPDMAWGLIAGQIARLRTEWDTVCEEATLTEVDKSLFLQRMFLNPFIFEGSPDRLRPG